MALQNRVAPTEYRKFGKKFGEWFGKLMDSAIKGLSYF